MSSCCRRTLTTILLTTAALVWPVALHAQIVVVGARSLNSVRNDFLFVASEAESREEATQNWEQKLLPSIPHGLGQAIQELDPEQPLGLFLAGVPAPKEAKTSTLVFFLPVKSEKAFLDWLKKHNLEPRTAGDGVYQLKLEEDMTLWFRCVQNHAFLVFNPDLLKSRLPAVADLVPPGKAEATLRCSLYPGRLTATDRDNLGALLEEFADKNVFGPKEQAPSETDADYKVRIGQKRLWRETVLQMIAGIKDMSMSLGVDQKQRQLVLEMTLTPQLGTPLGDDFKQLTGVRSMFSHMGDGAMLRFYAHGPFLKSWQEYFGTTLPELEQKALAYAGSKKEGGIIRGGFGRLKPSLQSDFIDLAVAVYRVPGTHQAVAVAGLKVKEADKLARFVRDKLRELPDADKHIRWKFARHGDIFIHRWDLKNDDMAKFFGTSHLYFAFLDEAVLISLGEKGQEYLERAIDDVNRQDSPPRAAPADLEVDVLQLVTLILEVSGEEKQLAKLRQIFPDSQTKVKFAMQVSWGETSRVRMTLDVASFRLFPLFAAEEK